MGGYLFAMSREPQRLHAITLHKLGWTQQAIADDLGVPRTTIQDWVNGNVGYSKASQVGIADSNADTAILTMPTFKSWCGPVEEFHPEGGEQFRVIMADPPWNVSQRLGDFSFTDNNGTAHTPLIRDFGQWDHFASHADYLNAVDLWLQQFYELAEKDAWCWFWCSYRYLSFIASIGEAIGWQPISWYVWLKTNPVPLLGVINQLPLASMEPCIIFRKGSPKMNLNQKSILNYSIGGAYQSPLISTKARPTSGNLAVKPVSLLMDIIEWSSKRGDWVLDAFAGSGSASEAALTKHRSSYAVDADPEQLAVLPFKAERWLQQIES